MNSPRTVEPHEPTARLEHEGEHAIALSVSSLTKACRGWQRSSLEGRTMERRERAIMGIRPGC
jgi:hypothetical protein